MYICFRCAFPFNRYRSLRTPTNKLVLSLVAADCLMMTKSWILVINGFAGGPLLGTAGEIIETGSPVIVFLNYFLCFSKIGCYVFACLGICAGLSQIWTIMIISLERVNAIFNPMSKTKRFGHVQVTRWVTCVWAASAFFSVAPLLGWNRYVSEVNLIVSCKIAFLLHFSFKAISKAHVRKNTSIFWMR